MQDIKGVLIDLDGVVHQRGVAIPGSVEAITELRRLNLDFRFVTNTTRLPLRLIAAELENVGVIGQRPHVFTPALAARTYIEGHGLDPYFVISSALREDFAGLKGGGRRAVVVGDAYDAFTYASLNEAFRFIEQGAEFLALATNRSFRDADGELSLDVGGFVACLEYAANRKARVLGKPSADFFRLAVADMGLAPQHAVMIGDDAEFDVSAAIKAGLHGILVRTGKYKPGVEDGIAPKPDAIANNLLEAIDLIARALKYATAGSTAATDASGAPGVATPDGYSVPAASRHRVADVPFDKAVRVGRSYTDKFDAWDRTPKGRYDPSLCRGLYRLPGGILFWESKMALDADGSPTQSVLDSSSDSAPETSLMFKPLHGRDAVPVNPEIVPYFVLPEREFMHDLGIPLGALGVIIYRDKITGAIFADEGPTMQIGEASIRVHELLLPYPAPWEGDPANKRLKDVSVDSGVLYFVFPNTIFDVDAYGPDRQSEMADAIHTAALAQFNNVKAGGTGGTV